MKLQSGEGVTVTVPSLLDLINQSNGDEMSNVPIVRILMIAGLLSRPTRSWAGVVRNGFRQGQARSFCAFHPTRLASSVAAIRIPKKFVPFPFEVRWNDYV